MLSCHYQDETVPNLRCDIFCQQNIDQFKQGHRRFLLMNFGTCVILAILKLAAAVGNIGKWSDDAPTLNDTVKVSHHEASSNLVLTLNESLYTGISDIEGHFIPIIITEDGRLLCSSLDEDTPFIRRASHFIEMIGSGLARNFQRILSNINHGMIGGLPILLMVGDINGCDITTRTDDYDFPRLTWSIPSHVYRGEDWCRAIGAPSYEIWRIFGKTYERDDVWDETFRKNEVLYPWSEKIPKAVWRGSMNFDQTQYDSVPFHEIPRAKLVLLSMGHSDVIDAAFTKIHQKFENRTNDLASETILTDRIPFDDQMKYQAIIDIDGNNWSARFSRLLCTNSVVIKIEPDFIEYFYSELRPNVHYIPASLDNITEVSRYVLNEANKMEMKNIIQAANSWCKRKLTTNSIINDAMTQLESYFAALDTYIEQENWHNEWTEFISTNPFDDLVGCGVRLVKNEGLEPA
ncbi:hypothetical protein ACHAWX_003049 [Stephanocyclus meneghinianus]